jgi:hypothetical protein
MKCLFALVSLAAILSAQRLPAGKEAQMHSSLSSPEAGALLKSKVTLTVVLPPSSNAVALAQHLSEILGQHVKSVSLVSTSSAKRKGKIGTGVIVQGPNEALVNSMVRVLSAAGISASKQVEPTPEDADLEVYIE